MGGRQSRQREQRGQDLKYEVDVDLREAYTGVKKEISYETLVTCDVCDGSGSESGSGLKTCGGVVGPEEQGHHRDFFTVERTCTACGGAGQVISDPVRHVMEREEGANIESLRLTFLQVLKKEVE